MSYQPLSAWTAFVGPCGGRQLDHIGRQARTLQRPRSRTTRLRAGEHLRIARHTSREAVFSLPTDRFGGLFPSANVFRKVERNSSADCGRAALWGLKARSKNCCHSAGASGKEVENGINRPWTMASCIWAIEFAGKGCTPANIS